MLPERLETVHEEGRLSRKSQEVAPVGQTFVENLYKEGDGLVQALVARDQQVNDELAELHVRIRELEKQVRVMDTQLGAAHQQLKNARVHIEDLQATTAAVTEHLNRELSKK